MSRCVHVRTHGELEVHPMSTQMASCAEADRKLQKDLVQNVEFYTGFIKTQKHDHLVS